MDAKAISEIRPLFSSPPPYRVTCSCGRSAAIHWCASLGTYITIAPGWAPHYPSGWTCGRETHTQVVPPRFLHEAPELPTLESAAPSKPKIRLRF